MNRIQKAAVGCLLVGVMGVAACGSDSREVQEGALVIDGETIADEALWTAAQQEGGLTIYSSYSLPWLERFAVEFKEEVGLNLDYVRLTGGPLFERVQAEKSAGTLAADILHTSDLGLVSRMDDSGVYEEYCPPGLSEIEDVYKPRGCKFFATQLAPWVITYNTAQVSADEAPQHWTDLLDPKWKGKQALQGAGNGGSAWALNSFYREEYGLEFWKDLAAQDPQITDTGAQPVDAVSRGEVPIATSTANNIIVAVEGGAPLGMVLPDEGTPTFAHWVGMVAGAEHPNAAKVYMNWVASKAGAKSIVEATGDWSVVPGSPTPRFQGESLPALIELKPRLMEVEPGHADKRAPWVEEWNAIFGYTPKS